MKAVILLCTLFAVSLAWERPELVREPRRNRPELFQESRKIRPELFQRQKNHLELFEEPRQEAGVNIAPKKLWAPSRSRTPMKVDNDGQDKIINGQAAGSISKYPYQVSLQVYSSGWWSSSGSWSHTCGGSILNNRAILTAAHCVDNGAQPANYRVAAGEYDLKKSEGTEQMMDISSFTIHSGWDASRFRDDIAIVKLSKALTFNSNVATVTLATSNPADDDPCTVTGWGYIDGANTVPSLLQQLQTFKGKESLAASQSQYYDPATQISTYGSNSGVCNGDSGGPLVYRDGSVYKQFGIVSYGTRPCGQAISDYYTRVTGFASWIKANE